MQRPETPPDEKNRLFALSGYQILDSEAEESYDRITRLAAEILDVPITLVSFVDENRQWFKSKYGMSVNETPREISFCGHAILQDDLFLVEDVLADERFRSNPLVVGEPKIGFYAGVPLKTPSGHNIGTLCAIDNKPRILTNKQKSLLTDLAKIVVDELELKQSKNRAQDLNDKLDAKVRVRTGALRDEIKKRRAANKALQETILDLKQTQAELLQVEKLKSLNLMIAGIGHEINTPIGIGVTAITHLLEMTEKASSLFFSDNLRKSDLEKHFQLALQSSKIIMNNLQRAADLVSSFKQIAVDQANNQRRQIFLGDYINEILLSLRPLTAKKNHIIDVVCSEKLLVDSYPGALSQILNNLVLNSFNHGFDDGVSGRIEIMVKENDNHVCLIYSDNGVGMSQETLQRVFDPFYTTKRGIGGTGLGMSVVHNLVTKTLMGKIKANSESGNGVRFEIVFPVSVEGQENDHEK